MRKVFIFGFQTYQMRQFKKRQNAMNAYLFFENTVSPNMVK